MRILILIQVRKQMTVFNVTKTLYNTELCEHSPSVLAAGEKEDRGQKTNFYFSIK
jgi:hypothetical protein